MTPRGYLVFGGLIIVLGLVIWGVVTISAPVQVPVEIEGSATSTPR